MQGNTTTRDSKTYVLTDHGFAKIEKYFQDKKLTQPKWVSHIFGKLSGTPNPDTIRKILNRTGVREDPIQLVFQALGLEAQRDRDYKLVSKDPENPPPPPKAVAYAESEPLPAIPVWRGRDLVPLQETLQGENLRVLALIGQGGIGKTAIAIKLMQEIKAQYQQVLYFRVRSGMSFDSLMGFLLPHLVGKKHQDLLQVADKIREMLAVLAQKRCLLVLDNLEEILQPMAQTEHGYLLPQAQSPELGQLLHTLVYGRHGSHVVITSRELPHDLTDRRSDGVLDPLLVKMEPITGVDLASGVQILQDANLQDSQADLEWVSERVGGHVLMLKLLAGVSRGRGYLRQHPELVQTQAAVVIRAQLQRLTPAAQDLLLKMAVLRQKIDIDCQGLTFLRLYTADVEQDDRFEMAVLLAEPVTFLRQELDATNNLVQTLVKVGLVQCSYVEAVCEEFYDLHPVISQFLQGEYDSQLPALRDIAYKFYCTGIDLANPKTRDDLRPVLEAQYFAFQLERYDKAEDLIYKAEKYLEPWGDWSELMALYEQILPRLNRHSRAYILHRIGIRHRDWGNWDKAEEFYRQGLAIAEEMDNQGLIAGLTGLLGEIERNRGNYDAAAALYQKCLAVEEELGDRKGMATSWGQLGDIERYRGNYDAAESLYQKSLQMMEELGDRSGMATSWGCLGEIAMDRGNWDTAKAFFEQCLQTMEELGNRAGIAECCKDMGIMETKRGKNYKLAQNWLQRSLKLYREMNRPEGIADTWEALGNLDLAQRNWTGAEDLYFNAVEIREEIMQPDHPKMADLWLGYGKAQMGKAKYIEEYYQQAAADLRRALTIYQKRLGADHYKTKEAQALWDEVMQKLDQ
ncbi:MAG: tetratricopeptide repeat protein [Pseudanabaena sp. ELA607]